MSNVRIPAPGSGGLYGTTDNLLIFYGAFMSRGRGDACVAPTGAVRAAARVPPRSSRSIGRTRTAGSDPPPFTGSVEVVAGHRRHPHLPDEVHRGGGRRHPRERGYARGNPRRGSRRLRAGWRRTRPRAGRRAAGPASSDSRSAIPSKKARSWRSSETAPFCRGVGAWTTRLSCTARSRRVRSGGVMTHPIRHPVERPVFEIEFTTRVRSAIPSNPARYAWRCPSKVMCS